MILIILNLLNCFLLIYIFIKETKFNIEPVDLPISNNFVIILVSFTIILIICKTILTYLKSYEAGIYNMYYLKYLNYVLIIINLFYFSGISIIWYKILVLTLNFNLLGYTKFTLLGIPFIISIILTNKDKLEYVSYYWTKLNDPIIINYGKEFKLSDESISYCLNLKSYELIKNYLDKLFESNMLIFKLQKEQQSLFSYILSYLHEHSFELIIISLGSVCILLGLNYIFNFNLLSYLFSSKTLNSDVEPKLKSSLNSIKDVNTTHLNLSKNLSNNISRINEEKIKTYQYLKDINLNVSDLETNVKHLDTKYSVEIPSLVKITSNHSDQLKSLSNSVSKTELIVNNLIKNENLKYLKGPLLELLKDKGVLIELVELSQLRKKYNLKDESSLIKCIFNKVFGSNNNWDSKFDTKPKFPGSGKSLK